MRYAVTIRRTMETTVIVDADFYAEAPRLARDIPLAFDPATAADTIVKVRRIKETDDAE